MKETRRQRIERRIKEAYAKGRRDELCEWMRRCEVCDAEHDAKIRAEMQEFVEKRCKELGIDYTLIFTCDGVN